MLSDTTKPESSAISMARLILGVTEALTVLKIKISQHKFPTIDGGVCVEHNNTFIFLLPIFISKFLPKRSGIYNIIFLPSHGVLYKNKQYFSTEDIKEGDVFILDYVPGVGVKTSKNSITFSEKKSNYKSGDFFHITFDKDTNHFLILQ